MQPPCVVSNFVVCIHVTNSKNSSFALVVALAQGAEPTSSSLQGSSTPPTERPPVIFPARVGTDVARSVFWRDFLCVHERCMEREGVWVPAGFEGLQAAVVMQQPSPVLSYVGDGQGVQRCCLGCCAQPVDRPMFLRFRSHVCMTVTMRAPDSGGRCVAENIGVLLSEQKRMVMRDIKRRSQPSTQQPNAPCQNAS